MDKKTSELEKLFGLWKDRGDETSSCKTVRLLRQARSFGMAKGELRYPDDIDFRPKSKLPKSSGRMREFVAFYNDACYNLL